jgi:hypothetical protein
MLYFMHVTPRKYMIINFETWFISQNLTKEFNYLVVGVTLYLSARHMKELGL